MSSIDYLLYVDFESYLNRYYEYTLTESTNQKAWQKVEKDCFNAVGKHRYSSYDSFRVVRDRVVKTGKQIKN
jgi:hypothetical protein